MTSSWLPLFHASESQRASVQTRSFRVLRRHGRDFLYLPDTPYALRALDLYPAQTPSAKAACLAVRTILALQWRSMLGRRTIAFDRESVFAQHLARLEARSDVPEFAILCGNPRARGMRHVFLLFNSVGLPTSIVKAGLGPEARELIIRESHFLRKHGGDTPSIPRLLTSMIRDDWASLALPYISGKSPYWDDAVSMEPILTPWLQHGQRRKLGTIPAWQRLEVAGHPLLPLVSPLLRDILVSPALFHGDFAPWNIRATSSGSWTVLDWERGEDQGIPGWDWMHYVVQTSILVGRERPKKTLERCGMLFASPQFTRYAELSGIATYEHSLLAAYLVHAKHLNPTEGSKELEELLRLTKGNLCVQSI